MKRPLVAGLLAAALVVAAILLFVLWGGFDLERPASDREGAQVAERVADSVPEPPPSAGAEDGAMPETKPEEPLEEEGSEPDAAPLLRGRVVGGGAGVAGADVRLWGVRDIEGLITKLERLGTDAAFDPDIPRAIRTLFAELDDFRRRAVVTRTDDDGLFELGPGQIRPGGYILLTIATDWLFRYGDVVAVDLGRTEEITIELERGAAISGRVVDTSGRALPNIAVIAEFRPAGTAGIGKVIRRALSYVNGEFLRGPFEARTGADGAFALTSLPPGTYDLVAADAHGVESRTEMIPTGSTDALVVLGPGATVEGVVADENGAPVAGVEVALEPEEELIEVPLPILPAKELVQQIQRYLGSRLLRTRSGADGRFTFAHVGAGKHRIVIDHPGLLSVLRTIEVGWGERHDAGVIRVDRGKIIRGTVLAADGGSIAGARVIAAKSEPGMLGLGVALKDTITGRIAAVSDADGGFLVSGLGSGEYTLSASSAGFGRGMVSRVKADDANENWVTITLEPGVDLRGKVVDAETGDPIARARVEANEVRSETDAEGRFVLEGVPTKSPGPPVMFGGGPRNRPGGNGEEGQDAGPDPGETSIRVRASQKGFVSQAESIALASIGEEIELRLERTPAIVGSVLDPEGDPLPGVLVRLAPDLPAEFRDSGLFDTSLIFFAVGVTGLDGTFRLDDFRIPEEGIPLCVVADAVGFPQARSEPFPIDRAGGAPLEIRLVPGSRIEGTVTDGRAPVAGAVVRLARERRDSNERMFFRAMGIPEGGTTVSTDADGHYVFAKVEAGDWDVSARKVGFIESEAVKVTVTAGDAATVDLVVDPGGSIVGEVVDDRREPVEGARIRVLRTGSRPEDQVAVERFLGGAFSRAVTSADGRFEAAGLPADTYALVVEKRGYAPLEVKDVAPGRDLGELVLTPAASIVVHVTDGATGLPVTEYRIACVREGDAPGPGNRMAAFFRRPRPHSDSEGMWRRDDADPGDYVLTVEANGWLPEERRMTLRPAATSEVDLPLVRAGRLVGRVVDLQTGRGIAGAEVALAREPRAPSEGDAQGDGRRGRNRWRSIRDREGAGDGSDETERDPEGPPSSDSSREDFVDVVKTDDDGFYALESMPSGPQTIVVSHDSYVESVVDGVEVPLGEERELSVRLDPGLSVSGRVVDPRGRPVIGQRMNIRGSSEATKGFSRSGWANDRGEFRFSGLTPGSYRVSVRSEGASAPVDVEVGPDGRGLDSLEIVIGE